MMDGTLFQGVTTAEINTSTAKDWHYHSTTRAGDNEFHRTR